ncbi:hypothetical protein [Halalkalicoccus sp. NIPERK01]|uniref:hypothetical protein n=1 Tax=Halalkalicoccus sp. NIPERK01 TaxID=3053469 RepID=UPI00256F4E15|nr:hypothetical protein [Halalkalicoccus sp. NIPERK01]MDL5361983.1 hypothetical protein [Halalkalicoccus sp. NIPERK01]
MQPTRDPDRAGAVAAARRRLYAGAGLCAGSVLGTAGAALLDVPVAVALFGGAVPLLGVQAYREYRLLDRLRRRSARFDDAYGHEALS